MLPCSPLGRDMRSRFGSRVPCTVIVLEFAAANEKVAGILCRCTGSEVLIFVE